jgi:uncharacterized OB-fold protein
VPWCEDCSRYLTPNSLSPRGECPSCGRVVAKPARTPWHFWVLLSFVVVYLGWRAIQGVVWAVSRLL